MKVTPARVPTLYSNWKNGKSIGLVNSVWEASVKNTGFDLTRCNFFLVCSEDLDILFSRPVLLPRQSLVYVYVQGFYSGGLCEW